MGYGQNELGLANRLVGRVGRKKASSNDSNCQRQCLFENQSSLEVRVPGFGTWAGSSSSSSSSSSSASSASSSETPWINKMASRPNWEQEISNKHRKPTWEHGEPRGELGKQKWRMFADWHYPVHTQSGIVIGECISIPNPYPHTSIQARTCAVPNPIQGFRCGHVSSPRGEWQVVSVVSGSSCSGNIWLTWMSRVESSRVY